MPRRCAVDFFLIDESKPARGLCCVKGCRHRIKRGKGRFCRRCRDRRYKIQSPVSYAYDKLKQSAKRRGHEFTLTVAELEMFFEANPALYSERGRAKECLSIDRIDATKGYSFDNIQVLTVSENGRKAHVDYFQNQAQLAFAPGEEAF